MTAVAAQHGSPTTYARHIGRIGALAMALGVGIAVASGQGMATARADDTDPNPTESSVTDPPAGIDTATTPSTDPTPEVEGKSAGEAKREPGPLVPRMKLRVSGGAHILRELKDRNGDEPDVVDTERTRVDNEDTQPAPPADEQDPDPTPPVVVPDAVKNVSPQRHSRPSVPSTRPLVQVYSDNATPMAATSPPRRAMPAVRQPAPRLLTAGRAEDLTTPAGTAQIATRTIAAPAPAADPLGASAALPGDRTSLVSRVVAVVIAPFLTPKPTAPPDSPVLLGVLAWARREIQRTFFNSTPHPVADIATTSEDVPLSGNVLTNDVDPDLRDVKTVTNPGTYTTDKGTLVLAADGSYTYTPNLNANGADSFTYTISDGNGGTATGTVSITITPVNDNRSPTPTSA